MRNVRRRERHVEGQQRLAEAVDADAVDVGRAREGRDDLDLVAGRGELAAQLVDLHLDAAEPGHVAVGGEQDLQRAGGIGRRGNRRQPNLGPFRAHATAGAARRPPMPHTLVTFHAHPDDEALLTAGVMAKAADAGHRVVAVFATAGEAGDADPSAYGAG